MNLIKPKKLNLGDKIKIIAPSGSVDIDKINNAKFYFEQKGYRVELASHIKDKDNYLAGSDECRLLDLHDAFADPEIKAIICARGGYGALRLIDKVDYNLVKNNPKIFCGFSDITLLNAMFLKCANLITFSGPMAQSDFGNDIHSSTEKSFFEVLTTDNYEITPSNPIIFNNGSSEGILFGGNLSSIVSLCGRDFIPDNDFLFFVEDLNEPVYKIDRYFTQLLAIKKFKLNLKAIILGDFLEIDSNEYFKNFFFKLAKDLNIPIISGYPISHSNTKATIPYGALCKLKDTKLQVSDYLI